MELTDDTSQYRDIYNIKQLELTDNNTQYYSKAVISDVEDIGNVIVNNIRLGRLLVQITNETSH